MSAAVSIRGELTVFAASGIHSRCLQTLGAEAGAKVVKFPNPFPRSIELLTAKATPRFDGEKI